MLWVVEVEQQEGSEDSYQPTPHAKHGGINKVNAFVGSSDGVGKGLLLVVVAMDTQSNIGSQNGTILLYQITNVVWVHRTKRVYDGNVVYTRPSLTDEENIDLFRLQCGDRHHIDEGFIALLERIVQ